MQRIKRGSVNLNKSRLSRQRKNWLVISGALSALVASQAHAETILLTNDDGLSSNVVALYRELKAQGHDVIVSVPCTGQSGMGAAIFFLRPLEPLKQPCLNNAGTVGDPGAGPMTRDDLPPDFFYVNGTPVMALLYGLDIEAQARWGRAPDLVLSGPNEGRNAGYIVISSGTVSNAQYAAMRGIPAIAVSAGENTRDNPGLANPVSSVVGRMTTEFVARLIAIRGDGPILPAGTALNVNFPDQPEGASWQPTKIGTFNRYVLGFSPNLARGQASEGGEAAARPGVSISISATSPRADQQHDEAVVSEHAISVSIMQIAYDGDDSQRAWLARALSQIGQDRPGGGH